MLLWAAPGLRKVDDTKREAFIVEYAALPGRGGGEPYDRVSGETQRADGERRPPGTSAIRSAARACRDFLV
jgi:hypothetical protein